MTQSMIYTLDFCFPVKQVKIDMATIIDSLIDLTQSVKNNIIANLTTTTKRIETGLYVKKWK